MRGTILQPTYLPWIGYFEMIAKSEVFVIFDHVQFVKKSWQQRNRIKTPNGMIWLTIPVKKESIGTPINQIKIYKNDVLLKHWKTIENNYKKTLFFNKYSDVFEKLFTKEYRFLKDLNLEIIKSICDILKIETNIILSSELELNDEKLERTDKVINLCKCAGITSLYDAKGAKDLLNVQQFSNANISITFQDFKIVEYPQKWGDFIPYLSIIDLLFNCGPDSIKYL